ncbi:MAG: cytochrome c [Deltaproteobacteria bacterium]|nr:cytochrome c [Deltaproteobacteria bacterium]
MRSFAVAVAVLLALAPPVAGAAAAPGAATLSFERDGVVVKTLDRPALERACEPKTVALADPYYGRPKRFRACPLATVLRLGFGDLDAAARDGVEVFFRARDGYVKPASVARVREPGGWLAFADADRMRGDDPGWEPIDRRQTDPGPYYVVWENPAAHDPHRYPWPYQLVAIELGSFAKRWPHIAPTGAAAGGPAWTGFTIFRRECIACHAMNGEGGTIGPELNVPRSIVEYRPVDQLKAFIRAPQSFRYTSMPSHEHLSDAELDDLVAYFGAMRDRKHDPRAAARAEAR